MRAVSLCLPVVAILSSLSVRAASPAVTPRGFVAVESNLLLVAAGPDLLRVDIESETSSPLTCEITDVRDVARVDDRTLVAIDAGSKELVFLRYADGQFAETNRAAVELDPRRLDIDENGESICVTGRWSRSIQLIHRAADGSPEALPPTRLGFEAEEVLTLPGHRFLVADAFGGQLAIIQAATGDIVQRFALPGHHIGGLAMSHDGSSVLVTHQVLSRIARSDIDDVHWGSLMQNVVTRIPIDSFGSSPEAFSSSMQKIQIGDVGRGFADPTGVISLEDGFAVLSGGSRQLAFYQSGRIDRRVDVGRRPIRLLRLEDGRLASLNQHDASLTVVDIESGKVSKTISLTDDVHPVSAGEAAFYDASLSHDSWMSCNSCHIDGHTPDLLADTFGDGAFGNPKRIPSLFGSGETLPLGWLGNKLDLPSQISATLTTTMHHSEPSDQLVAELSEFVGALAVPSASANRWDVKKGQRVFESHKCNQCHTPPTFTSKLIRDVGLRDELANREFNPPSLRGVRHRRAFFHDGRAVSLEEVFGEFKHQVTGENQLTEDELQYLIEYLRTL